MRKTARDVIAEVAARHGMQTAQLLSKRKSSPFAHPRQEAMFECYLQCPHLSFPAIARAFGNMHHTTIIWGIKKQCERIGISYASIRRTTKYYTATDERNLRIGFVPKSPSDFRAMARL